MGNRSTTTCCATGLLRGLAIAAALLVVAGAAAATPASTESSSTESAFFRLSPIEAVSLAGRSLTRYSVSVSNAPVGNTPFARWYLDLPAGADGCTNELVPGGTRLSPTRYVWKNQGTSFTWYHGAKGSYPADRAYGCDQAKIGQAGYPGAVTVVLENDSQHCTATFAGTAPGPEPEPGPQPVCGLGGYIPLPLPRGLLQTYATVDRGLARLIAQAQAGRLEGGALRRAVTSTFEPQSAALARLFPPIWGCDFGTLFNPLLTTEAVVAKQITALATARRLPGSSLAVDAGSVTALDRALRACEPSSSRPIGVPLPVVRAVGRLAGRIATIQREDVRGLLSTSLQTKLIAFNAGLNAIVAKSFPVVFDIPYLTVLDRVLAESSELELAERAGTGTDAVVSALRQAAARQDTLTNALREQARHAASAEKSA